MDQETTKQISDIKLDLYKTKLEALATRVGLMAVMRTHPDRKNLLLAFDAYAEQSIAQTLPAEYPDELVFHFRDELDRLREFLQSIPAPSQQGKD
jgi:hypothetical protein